MNLLLGFDKQILEYNIEGVLDTDEINVIANASDANATINGTGKIKLETNQEQIRIDVTSESGTVRTYLVNVNKATEPVSTSDEEDDKTIQTENQEEPENNMTITEDSNTLETESISDENNNSNSSIVLWIILGAILIIVVIIIIVQKRKNK